jgi:capsular exopolysaccharide synthesis family protein
MNQELSVKAVREADSVENEIDLREYVRVLRRHRWVVFFIFLFLTGATTIFSLTATPIYQGTTTLIIEPHVSKAMSVEDLYSADIKTREYFQSQIEIVKSRPVAELVVAELNLAENKNFLPDDESASLPFKWWRDLSGLLTSIRDLIQTPAQVEVQDEESLNREIYTAYDESLSVQPVRDTNLILINFQSPDPKLAAATAEAVTRNFIRFDLQNRIDTAQQSAGWLNSRMDEARAKVELTEKNLQDYKEQHNIITAFSGENEKLTAQTLSDINKQLSETKAARVEAEERYRHASSIEVGNLKDLESIPTVLSNPTIAMISQQEIETAAALAEISKTFGVNHPQIVALEAKLHALQEKKGQEIRKVINSLKSVYEVVRARELSLRNSLEEIKKQTQQLNRKALEFGVLQREVESASNMYEILLTRFKETSLSALVSAGNMRIVEHAQAPEYPIKPNKKKNVLLAAVLGLMMGCGFAFFLEYLDNTIKSPDDLKRYKLAYLAPVPFIEPNEEEKLPFLVAYHTPKSSASEAYRSLRTSLLFSSAEHPPQVLMISSPGPGEGKSITCANLAVTMAQAGSKTIILDCDLRRPRIHKYFALSREQGMSNILTGSEDVTAMILATDIPNLYFIPSGPVPPNPSELLGAKRMDHLIEVLRKSYDRIIIDAPPVSAVTDASILTHVTDGLVLIVRSKHTIIKQLESTLEILRPMPTKILGVVLNAVDLSKDNYYYYNYNYYGESAENEKPKKRRHKSDRPY